MLRLAGPIMCLFAVIHLIATVVLFPDGLTGIWRTGLFGGLAWDMEMRTAYWFALLAWPFFELGRMWRHAVTTTGDIPLRRSIGAGLIVVPLLSGLIQPVSGLWLFMVPGLMLLFGKPVAHPHDARKTVAQL